MRIGESDEIPITEAGRLSAHTPALRFARGFQPALLISNTFPHARQTSEILSPTLGIQLVNSLKYNFCILIIGPI